MLLFSFHETHKWMCIAIVFTLDFCYRCSVTCDRFTMMMASVLLLHPNHLYAELLLNQRTFLLSPFFASLRKITFQSLDIGKIFACSDHWLFVGTVCYEYTLTHPCHFIFRSLSLYSVFWILSGIKIKVKKTMVKIEKQERVDNDLIRNGMRHWSHSKALKLLIILYANVQ